VDARAGGDQRIGHQAEAAIEAVERRQVHALTRPAAAATGAATAAGRSTAAATTAPATGAESREVEGARLQLGIDLRPRAPGVVIDLAGDPARPGLDRKVGEAGLPGRAGRLGRQLEGAGRTRAARDGGHQL